MVFYLTANKKQKFGRKFTLFLWNTQQKEQKSEIFLAFVKYTLHKKREHLAGTLLIYLRVYVRVRS